MTPLDTAGAAERERADGIADPIDLAGRSAWAVAVDIAAAIRAGG